MRQRIKSLASRLGAFEGLRAVELLVHARLGRVHDPDYLRLRDLPLTGLIADVGANLGQSIVSFTRLLPGLRIRAFEPNPSCQPLLRKVIRACGASVVVHEVGLAEADGVMEFFVPYDKRGTQYLQEGSFDRAVFEEHPARYRIPHPFHLKCFPVRVTTLDRFPGPYGLLKIDVQGLELAVLHGATQTIRRDRPVILLEREDSRSPAVEAFLSELGYGFVPLSCNTLCLPS